MDTAFEGTLGRTVAESTPWWPAPPQPPEGSPNVVFIVFDDMGFSDLGCYGSEIATPNVDRLADEGLRYTNFHTTALCSPTRACLLTGRNHHSVGMASLANWDMGFPGSRGAVSHNAGTLAEMLRPHGYNTFAVGKWHLTPLGETSAAGPFDNWPLQRGFDRFYGFLGGATNQWHPELTEDNHPLDIPNKPGYHLTEDLVDRSIALIQSQQTVAPGKPFFLYLAFGAQHAPHHVPREYIDKYVSVFEKGWDQTRDDRLARQKAIGVVPEDTELPPRNDHVRPWDSHSEDEQRLFVRFQAAYAGMLEHTDYHVGRLVDTLEEMGLRENTLIVLISDNGASQEGSPFGTVNALRHFNRVRDTLDSNLPYIDEIGAAEFRNNYPFGWAMAGNTPLKRYKQNTHGGGVKDPLIVSWPGRITGGGIRTQFHHVTDVVPTVLEAVGVAPPAEVNGAPQGPIEGTSMLYSWDEPESPTRKQVQYFEMLGHRAIWSDGWKAVTWHRTGTSFDDDQWELYYVAEDISESHDLATEYPEKLKELVALWWAEADKYQVLPLDDRTNRWSSGNPFSLAARDRWVIYPGASRLPGEVAPDIRNRSYAITAEVDVPDGGVEGVLVVLGESLGGFALYVEDGRLVHDYNYLGEHFVVRSAGSVPAGRCVLRYEHRRTGGNSARGTVLINGTPGGSVDIPRTYTARASVLGMQIGQAPAPAAGRFEAPFPFTGTLHRVTFELIEDQDADNTAATQAALSEQ